MVIGFKIWWADGTKSVVPVSSRTRQQVAARVATLPTTGCQVIMVYFDEFSVDGKTRYRRVIHGNDYFFIFFDNTGQPHDWAFGQTNNPADIARYPSAVTLTGSLINDTAYKAYNDAAMSDMNVSEFGLTPVPNTDDR